MKVNKERKTQRSRRDDVTLELVPVLGAPQGIQLHARLNEVIDTSGMVTLDASKVERIESLALQVLLAFFSTRVAADQGVEWMAVSSEFRRASDLLGLSEILRLPA